MIIGIRHWAVVVGIACIVAAGLVSWIAAPSAPEVCRDTAELISADGSARKCPRGARIEVWPSGKYALVKCICERQTGK